MITRPDVGAGLDDGAVKNRTAPIASRAPPAMKPASETVLSVETVEWSDSACARFEQADALPQSVFC